MKGLEPSSANQILVSGSPMASHAVDVSEHIDRGVASLQAHAEYLRGLGANALADPQEYLESLARQTGTRFGTRFAVAFEVITV